MPYVTKFDREILDDKINEIMKPICSADVNGRSGLINYAITRMLMSCYCIGDKPCYNNINSAIGILECAKLEMYRRLSQYENKKIKDNGDVEEYAEFNRTMDKK